ncbi:MAG: hypothetical protein WDZ77_00025 [Candidatus Pacearchaeota archaeon]
MIRINFEKGILEVRKGKLQYLEHVFEDNQLKFSLIGIEGIRAVGIEERWNPQISDCSNKDFQEAYGNIPYISVEGLNGTDLTYDDSTEKIKGYEIEGTKNFSW